MLRSICSSFAYHISRNFMEAMQQGNSFGRPTPKIMNAKQKWKKRGKRPRNKFDRN